MTCKSAFIAILVLAPALVGGEPDKNQAPEQFGLNHLTEYLGLKPGDISYRPDYTDRDAFRLKVVADLMDSPLGMIDYSASLRSAHVVGQPEIMAGILFQDLAEENQARRSRAYRAEVSELNRSYNYYYNDVRLNQLLTRAATYLEIIFPRSVEQALSGLSSSQVTSLKNEFKQLIIIREDLELLSVDAIDSLDKVEEAYCEKFVEFGAAIDKDPIIAAGIDCLRELVTEINHLRSEIRAGRLSAATILKNTVYLPKGANRSAYLGAQRGWKIGGTGNDYYTGEYQFILDFGGDDIYDLSADLDDPTSCIIIDLSGDDSYRANSDGLFGSGFLSAGLLLDFEGNDTYRGRSFSMGSGFFGIGVLYDAEGDDIYEGDTFVQGAGAFGLGLLIDEDGRDIYSAAVHAQGFGFVRGLGMIYDRNGADSYYAGGKYNDILRYKDHYLSLSQGFGIGRSPFMSGGIGALIDISGNDNYYSDIYGQGASYWWSLGILYDSAGNDNYQSYQYAQGSAAHMTLGLLVDDAGNDVYFGKGLMQGVGHDYACGIILDRGGDDVYTAYDLGQGSGSANGAGVLIDVGGDDRYFIKNPDMTQGYGNPRRDFGSIGLFIDLGGQDLYNGNGRDNYYWKTKSKWGGGMDIELDPPEPEESRQ